MPELPEVEQFRQFLLPLVATNTKERNSSAASNPDSTEFFQVTKYQDYRGIDLSSEQVHEINSNRYQCIDVVRKGKQLCLILQQQQQQPEQANKKVVFLYVHMGMTGRINVPGTAIYWGDKTPLSHVAGSTTDGKVKDENGNYNNNPTKGNAKVPVPIDTEEFPPKYTVLVFQFQSYVAAFADPRKFGKCSVHVNISACTDTNDTTISADPFNCSGSPYYGLAYDALTTTDVQTIDQHIIPSLANQVLGIKAILLDQKRVVSGIGNWIADEVLYQSMIHPDQKYLTFEEAQVLWEKIHSVCRTGVDCLTIQKTHYPDEWLFGYRWSKKQTTKDYMNRTITFLTSGGRTSAIVASIQKLYKRNKNTIVQQLSSSIQSTTNEESTTSNVNKRTRKLNNVDDEVVATKQNDKNEKTKCNPTPILSNETNISKGTATSNSTTNRKRQHKVITKGKAQETEPQKKRNRTASRDKTLDNDDKHLPSNEAVVVSGGNTIPDNSTSSISSNGAVLVTPILSNTKIDHVRNVRKKQIKKTKVGNTPLSKVATTEDASSSSMVRRSVRLRR